MEESIKNILTQINEKGVINVNILQERFEIGYSRASLFMDKLIENNIIEDSQEKLKPILNKEKFFEEGMIFFAPLENNQ